MKPERSRHCEICDSCVMVYDHHCPWIANCVGANNYWAFFCFLLSMFTFIVYTIIFEIISNPSLMQTSPITIGMTTVLYKLSA